MGHRTIVSGSQAFPLHNSFSMFFCVYLLKNIKTLPASVKIMFVIDIVISA